MKKSCLNLILILTLSLTINFNQLPLAKANPLTSMDVTFIQNILPLIDNANRVLESTEKHLKKLSVSSKKIMLYEKYLQELQRPSPDLLTILRLQTEIQHWLNQKCELSIELTVIKIRLETLLKYPILHSSSETCHELTMRWTQTVQKQADMMKIIFDSSNLGGQYVSGPKTLLSILHQTLPHSDPTFFIAVERLDVEEKADESFQTIEDALSAMNLEEI